MIGIIGYRGHAKRHIKYLQELGQEVTLYHPKKYPNFERLFDCNGIIISSPTNTHMEYVRKLSEYKGKIYLEKPGFTNPDDAFELGNCGLNIMIGYHYPHTILKNISEMIKGETILSFDIIMSKGIAYKKPYKDRGSVSELGLGHVISIYKLFGGDIFDIKTELYYNNENGIHDTAVAVAPRFRGTFTWGGPLLDPQINIVTTNSLVNVTSSSVTVKSPRDTFDSNGWFTEPPIKFHKSIDGFNIKPCLQYFLENDTFSRKDLKHSIDISLISYYNK